MLSHPKVDFVELKVAVNCNLCKGAPLAVLDVNKNAGFLRQLCEKHLRLPYQKCSDVMNIKVNFNNPYSGAIHARNHRKRECMQLGDGSNSIALSINLLAKQGQSDYCDVLAHNVSSEVRTPKLYYFCLYVIQIHAHDSSKRKSVPFN